MKLTSGVRLGVLGVTAAALTCFGGDRAASQDVSKAPTFGSARLKAGFEPDPFKVPDVISGGAIQTDKGGIEAWISSAPDYRLNYTAGEFKLTIKFVGTGDTTLLINTPDGKWVADDDSDGDLNPRVTFNNPKSGQYDIWVGTIPKKNEKGTLIITEKKQN
jgi:serine protease Do